MAEPEVLKVPREMRGFLEIEDEEVKFFTRRFFQLCRERDVLEYYKQDPRSESSALDGSINILNVTKVAVSSQRPKKDNCFEISLTDKKYFLSAPNIENMRDWVNALHDAAVNPRYRTKSLEGPKKQDSTDEGISYQTSIIGGVVMKVPNQKDHGEDQSGGHSFSRTGGLRPIKEGWCFKQGARMKNWKRRYFTLSVVKLSYFENQEEKTPLRSILTQDLKAVREVPGFSGKDNVLEIETPYRKFYMQPDCKKEVKEWKKAIDDIRFSSGSSTTSGTNLLVQQKEE